MQLPRIFMSAFILILGATAMAFVPILPRSAGLARPDLPATTSRSDDAMAIAQLLAASGGRIDAAVILLDGQTMVSWGDADRPMNVASVRKSLLGLLFGIAADKGLVNLDATLAELGIDETATPLTPAEAQATVLDLLSARSGIYLPGDAEGELAASLVPLRGADPPGSAFHYGNWGFNVLGAIFERETGLSIGAAFADWIAGPVGMQDFGPQHVWFDRDRGPSDYPAYRIQMSARDLARLGALIAAQGVWRGRRVIPADWIDRSAFPASIVGPPLTEPPFDAYGLSWWLDPRKGDMVAAGWGGQFLFVGRQDGLSVALLNDTGTTVGRWLWFRMFGSAAGGHDLLAILGLLR
jgi:CubicO group peptidase (beta-lactamase class C family)